MTCCRRERRDATFSRAMFHRTLADMGVDSEDAGFVLDSLPDPFTSGELDLVLSSLHGQEITRPSANRTIEHLRLIASCNYEVRFPKDSTLDQRVLMPTAPTESHGMEDARFVRFTDDDGTVTYHATYTAFDGASVAPQLLTTTDFLTFQSSQLTGPAAANKGMALFPRRVDGRYMALSRWDRENTSVATSADGHGWDAPTTIHRPRQPWELIQIGNCGSPIETEAGWLVLTHGVGPMRTLRDRCHAARPRRSEPRHRPADRTAAHADRSPSATGTCRTWSTRAARWLTAIGSCCRTAAPTARSGSP